MVYAATHTEQVKRLVLFDAIKPVSRDPAVLISRTRASVDDLISIEKKKASGSPTPYTYEGALKRLLEGSNQIHGKESINLDSAKILLKRGLKRASSEDKDEWEFTRDLKHRIASLYGYPQEVIVSFANEVKCPHLIVKAKEGRFYEKDENVQQVLKIYRENNSKFSLVEVDGNHHVHLNNADQVWPVIEDFLKSDKAIVS